MEDKVYNIKAATAQKYFKSMATRYEAPATVFCSRELEAGLNEFMASEMTTNVFPTDEALRAQARKILGVENTAADDPHLLEKFKAMHNFPSDAPPTSGPITEFNEAEMLAKLDHELATGNMDFGASLPGIWYSQQTQQAMDVAKGCANLYHAHTQGREKDGGIFPMSAQQHFTPQAQRPHSTQNGASPSMPGFPSSGGLL